MRRVLYNPLNLVKNLIGIGGGGGGGGGSAPAPSGPSAAELRAQEQAAREEASRRATAEAAARAGNRQTLLTDGSTADTFGSTRTKRKSLLGA